MDYQNKFTELFNQLYIEHKRLVIGLLQEYMKILEESGKKETDSEHSSTADS